MINIHLFLNDEYGGRLLLLWSSGEGQARIGKGWPLRWKASKLKPEPRAYTKVGREDIGEAPDIIGYAGWCHHPR